MPEATVQAFRGVPHPERSYNTVKSDVIGSTDFVFPAPPGLYVHLGFLMEQTLVGSDGKPIALGPDDQNLRKGDLLVSEGWTDATSMKIFHEGRVARAVQTAGLPLPFLSLVGARLLGALGSPTPQIIRSGVARGVVYYWPAIWDIDPEDYLRLNREELLANPPDPSDPSNPLNQLGGHLALAPTSGGLVMFEAVASQDALDAIQDKVWPLLSNRGIRNPLVASATVLGFSVAEGGAQYQAELTS